MNHYSIGDGLTALALAGAFIGYFYLKYREKQGRLEIIHRERLAAMDKGIPLPELPLDPPMIDKRPDPHVHLVIGIVLMTIGAGAMIALRLVSTVENPAYWPLPLPLATVGLGLMFYYFLAAKQER